MLVSLNAYKNNSYKNNVVSFQAARLPKPKVLIMSDLDGTWVSEGNPLAQKIINDGIGKVVKNYAKKGVDVVFGYVTGRPPELVLNANLPKPDWTLTLNGALMNKGFPKNAPLKAWSNFNKSFNYDKKVLVDSLLTLSKDEKYKNLVVQPLSKLLKTPSTDKSKFATIYCIEKNSIKLNEGDAPLKFTNGKFEVPEQMQKFLADFKKDIASKNSGECVIEPYPLDIAGKSYIVLDMATPAANKGASVNFLMKHNKVKPQNLIIAGDSFNDLSMMQNDGRNVIIAGNNSALREKALKLNNDKLYFVPDGTPSSVGVLKGIISHLKGIYENMIRSGEIKVPKQSAGTRKLSKTA